MNHTQFKLIRTILDYPDDGSAMLNRFKRLARACISSVEETNLSDDPCDWDVHYSNERTPQDSEDEAWEQMLAMHMANQDKEIDAAGPDFSEQIDESKKLQETKRKLYGN